MKTVDLVELTVWATRLCRLPDVDPLHVVAALGVGPAPASYIRGVGRSARPPIGTTRCEVGVVGGRFRSLCLTFAVPDISRHDLEDAFGQGTPLRKVRPLAEHQVAYRVVVPDAVYSVDVVASFAERPARHSVATRVMLRRRRGCDATTQPGQALRTSAFGRAPVELR